MWARYKQTRPDTYKSSQKYTPTRRDRGYSIDKFGRSSRLNSYEGKQSVTKQFVCCFDCNLFIYWSVKTSRFNFSLILIFCFL